MNNAELIRDCKILRKEWEEFCAVRKVALQGFEKCSLKTLSEKSQPAWMQLSSWYCNGEVNRQGPFFAFTDEEEAAINSAFAQVSEARINREEFTKIMEPYIKRVSDYSIEFSEALAANEKAISEAYERHFGKDSDTAYFFRHSLVKEKILSFLQEE